MFGQPTARVGSGSAEGSMRQLLDTTAAVAADPDGYKERLAKLDEATTKALEEATKARAERQLASDLMAEAKSEQQKLETAKADLADATARARDEIQRERRKHDDVMALDRAKLKADGDELAARLQAAERLKAELQTVIADHAKATADLNGKIMAQAQAVNELTKATAAAKAREAQAAETVNRARAFVAELPK